MIFSSFNQFDKGFVIWFKNFEWVVGAIDVCFSAPLVHLYGLMWSPNLCGKITIGDYTFAGSTKSVLGQLGSVSGTAVVAYLSRGYGYDFIY